MASNAIDLVGDSSDESEASRSPSPPPTVPSRPKLRTRRAIAYEEEGDSSDAHADAPLRVVLRANTNGHTTTRANATTRTNANGLNRPRRQQNKLVLTRDSSEEDGGGDEEEEEEERHDADDDYEQPAERMEEEEEEEDDFDSSVEEEEEETVGRRRSGRARRTVRRTDMQEDDESEDYGDDFEIRVVRRRGGGGGGGLEHSTRPRRAPAPKPARPPPASTGRKRKRPSSAASSSSSRAKSKTRKPRQRQYHSDDDEGTKRQASDSSDVDADWLLSDDEDDDGRNGKARGNGKDDDDEIDENAFIVEKILAREVHTLKEWTRLRANKTTRFLTNASIFLDDSDDEGGEQEPKRKRDDKAEKKDDANDDVVVVLDGPADTTADQKEEERYLIKWKNLSYIHVSWETEKNLMEVDRNVKGKIQRFREKEMLGLISDRMHGDEYFNPEFRDVDRILDIQDKPGDKYTPVDDEDDEDNDGKPKLKYMLIKWKAQPYDMITWEREDDVHDDAAVKDYEARLARAAERYKRMATTKSARSKARKNPKFRGYSATNTPPFKEGQTFELRDYQLTGVNWMLFNWYQGRNSMLADEMGLGKTVQTVTYINHLAVVEELPGPYLIVAPLSTLGHWQREFTNWTNLNAVVYHGSAEARKVIQDYEFFLTDAEYRKAAGDGSSSKAKAPKINGGTCYRFDVLITTYEMCGTPDFAKLARVKWQLFAVDEAHRLKNRNSKLSVLIQKNFNYDNILLLTGTPLQNNVEELWTLLNFLDPDRFDSMEDFLLDYGELKDVSQVEKLHGELKPFLLRRMKEDVEKSLAPKEETIIEVELTVLQKQYYRAIFEQNTEFLARGMKRSHAPSLMNVLMELRKCCNHPFLIKGMEQREVARIREQKDLAKEEAERQAVELLVTASGKLILLDKLLPRLKENGHRVLIFSQFKIMLDILQDYLRLRSYRCERIDGNITGNDRQAAIDRFSDPESLSFIMLLSTRAGGVGINLTSADTVIIYDSDWNPQNDLQAQARCHRIGQKKSVKIYRLLTAKTYELHMFHQASLKLGLDQAVLGSIRDRQQHGATAVGTTKRPNAPMSKDEIENLLKHGAYEMFKEDKDGEAEAASKRFSEESIDQILSRSTTIIHDPKADKDGDEANGKKNLMSSFSKATFVSSDNPDAQVALDDPDFWTKVIGLQAPEKVEPSPLRKRRCRREVKSYLQEDSGEEETKKRGRGRPKKQDADFEEYVISSSSSDDEDEDGTDELDDDDFEDGKKPKSKRQAKTKLPKLYLYQDRICDLLTTFGYGRWKEIADSSPILSMYSLSEIATFSHELLASLVRVAATTYVVTKTAPQPPVGADGQVLLAAPVPSAPPTQQQLNDALDAYASRYRFVPTMLIDTKVQNISQVLVYSPGLQRTAPTIKAERDAASKLQQIDRMYSLHLFVLQQIGPIAPMNALISDLLRVKDRTKIPRAIMECVLPPHRPQKPKTPTPTKPTVGGQKTDDSAATTAQTESATTSVTVGQVVAEGTVVHEDTVVEEKTTVKKDEPDGDKIVATATAPVDATATTSPATPDDRSQAPPADESGPSSLDQPAPSPAVEGGDKKSEKTNTSDQAQTEPTATTNGQSQPPLNEPASAPDEKKEDGDSSEAAERDDSATATAEPPQEPSTTVTSLSVPMIKEQHLRVAMSRLQALPDVGVPESVAPWWISIVDDVLLLLYVHKHGWIKVRALPSSLTHESMLFGARAAAHEIGQWPTVQTLNRRVRALLACWTNTKRLSAHANAVRAKERIRAAAKAAKEAKAAQRVLVPPALPPSLQAPLSNLLAPSRLTSETLPQPLAGHLHHHRLSMDDETVQAEIASKRMRFAKLVHQHGIPDVRGCSSDQDQLEKWRHFRQDIQLRLARFPVDDLLQEARDLERFCRLHQDETVADRFLQPSEPAVPSIFGSYRGRWGLKPPLCRRIVHRIELFRALRLELLVLPLQPLVEIVNKVIDEIYVSDHGAMHHYPSWWESPKHDILLLQGVEHYGLDTGVDDVWTLQYFVATNPSKVYPSHTWVENHVHNMVVRAHRILKQVRQIQARQQANQAVDGALAAQQQEQQQQRERERLHEQLRLQRAVETVERQRFRDLHGMRQEDPHFSLFAKQRKARDTIEFEKAEAARMPTAESAPSQPTNEAQTAAQEMMRAVQEAQQMKREDPHHSLRMRAVQVQQNMDFAAEQSAKAAANARRAASAQSPTKPPATTAVETPTPKRRGRPRKLLPPPPRPVETEVIELDDDDDEDEDEEESNQATKRAGELAEAASATTSASQTPETTAESKAPATAKSTVGISPQKDPVIAGSAELSVKEDEEEAEDKDEESATASATAGESGDESSPSSATPPPRSRATVARGQKRKRAPRPWEVIVIDDSDDSDEDGATPVKRTTRSRRRYGGEQLTDGL